MITKILFLLNVSFVFSIVDVHVQRAQLRRKPSSLVSVDTSLGKLVGYQDQALNRTFNVFYGVPYAEPPINELRFRRSKLIQRFPNEPYSALDYKPHCAQPKRLKFHPHDKFSEDW